MLGSPVYGRLARHLAEDPRPAHAILGDDASWDLGLRLFGAVHHHVLTGAAPEALSGRARSSSPERTGGRSPGSLRGGGRSARP